MPSKVSIFLLCFSALLLSLFSCNMSFDKDMIHPTVKAKGLPEDVEISTISLTVDADDIEPITKNIEPDNNEFSLKIPRGTERQFRLKVETQSGTYSGIKTVDLLAGKEINIVIKLVEEITNLTVTEGDGFITLSWKNPNNEEFDHCEIVYDTTENAAVKYTGSIDNTGTIIEDLTNDTEYTFTVRTVDKEGNVSLGMSITAIPQFIRNPDGITWIQSTSNPVLTNDDLNAAGLNYADWEGLMRSGLCVIKDNETLKMWNNGQNNSKMRIGYATSGNGTEWTPVAGSAGGGAVFQNGTSSNYHATGCCIINDNGTYKMWWLRDNNGSSSYQYTTSSDGINWSSSNQVLDDNKIGHDGSCWVIKEQDGTYNMWYNRRNNNSKYLIDYATSNDGIDWTKHTGSGTDGTVLGLGTSGRFDDKHVLHPTVIKEGDIYKMWYYGIGNSSKGIGYATSEDGINWTKHYQTDTSGGQLAGFPVDARNPTVIPTEKGFAMWYQNLDSSTGLWEINHALCE